MKKRGLLAGAIAACALALLGAGGGAPPPQIAAGASGWPEHDYNLANTRADTASEIDAANVASLQPKWTFKLPDRGEYGSFTTNAIVLGNVVYFESPKANVFALNASTGKLIWEHRYNTLIPSGGPTGLALGYGMLFGSTATAAFALDPATGKQLWLHRLAFGPHEGIDSTPTVFDDKVLISTIPGSATSFYDGGAWGTVYALDASTGKTLWSFSTVKGGASLWGDPKENGGGGTWYPAAVDSAGRVFLGIGNPSPVYSTSSDPNASSRPGPDLYTDSLVALDGSSGRLLWYHQVTPHDVRDFDFQDPPILATERIDGKPTEVVIGAGKSGKVLAFRAGDGAVLWTLNIGRHNSVEYGPLPSKPALMCPGPLGGVLTPMAYTPGVVYVPWIDVCITFGVDTGPTTPTSKPGGGVAAVDAATGHILWATHLPSVDTGAATIANNVVLTSNATGVLYALSTKTGRILWSAQTPDGINGFPAITKTMLIIGAGLPDAKLKNPQAELVAYALPAKG
jgi:glucose dehydrogenase